MNTLVSVVIPTLGREVLHRAVQSAASQVGIRTEVLVVVNGTEHLPSIDNPKVSIIDGRQSKGQGFARQLGVELATGELVALLDDDDYWEPEKLARQIDDVVALRDSLGGRWIAATGLRIHQSSGTIDHRPYDNSSPMRISDVPSWLFRRASLARQDHFLQSSSLLFPKSIARESPFTELPEIHTDWGWILATQQRLGADVLLCSGHATHYDVSSRSGVTRGHRYLDSIAWAKGLLSDADPKTVADFLLAVPSSMAATAGDRRGVVECARHATAISAGDAPAWLFWSKQFVKSITHHYRGA